MTEPNKMDMPEFDGCPWCKEKPQVTQHYKGAEYGYGLVHRCSFMGPISFDFMPLERVAKLWNRNPPTVTADEAREALTALDNAGDMIDSWYVGHEKTIRRCISHFIPEGKK